MTDRPFDKPIRDRIGRLIRWARDLDGRTEYLSVGTDIVPVSATLVEPPMSRQDIVGMIEGGLNKILAGLVGKTAPLADKALVQIGQPDLFVPSPNPVEASAPAVITSSRIEIWGQHIRRDANGLMCLNDLHKAVGGSKNQAPGEWVRLVETKALIKAFPQTTDKTRSRAEDTAKSFIYTKEGRSGGTYAHENLALAYAKYLSPELHIAVNDVFLRFKRADITIADSVLARASEEEVERLVKREQGKLRRAKFTRALAASGVERNGFAVCTNATYIGLLGSDASGLKEQRGITKKSESLRDSMTTGELVSLEMAEDMAADSIKLVGARGTQQCAEEALAAAEDVRSMRSSFLANRLRLKVARAA